MTKLAQQPCGHHGIFAGIREDHEGGYRAIESQHTLQRTAQLRTPGTYQKFCPISVVVETVNTPVDQSSQDAGICWETWMSL